MLKHNKKQDGTMLFIKCRIKNALTSETETHALKVRHVDILIV